MILLHKALSAVLATRLTTISPGVGAASQRLLATSQWHEILCQQCGAPDVNSCCGNQAWFCVVAEAGSCVPYLPRPLLLSCARPLSVQYFNCASVKSAPPEPKEDAGLGERVPPDPLGAGGLGESHFISQVTQLCLLRFVMNG